MKNHPDIKSRMAFSIMINGKTYGHHWALETTNTAFSPDNVRVVVDLFHRNLLTAIDKEQLWDKLSHNSLTVGKIE